MGEFIFGHRLNQSPRLKVMMGCTITSITFARVSVQCSQGSLLCSVAGAALVLQALVRQLG